MHVSVFIPLASLILPSTNAHNWLTSPKPRAGLFGELGETSNCENTNVDIPTGNTYQRGEQIEATWTYNNHWGGFARFSIVPAGQETDQDALHDANNFIKISCMSQNCGGRRLGYDDPAYAYYSPWNLPAQDGIEQDNSSPELACRTMITIPDWLQDGKYVMQWVMYGVHDSYGVLEEPLPFFRNCANLEIEGGPEATSKPTDSCSFEWEGGDRSLSDASNINEIDPASLPNECSYWNFNSINSTGYYNPEGLAGPDGKAAHDKTAMRRGLPQEVIDCGGNVSGSSSGQATGATAAGAGQEDNTAEESTSTLVVQKTQIAQKQQQAKCRRSYTKRARSLSSIFWRKKR